MGRDAGVISRVRRGSGGVLVLLLWAALATHGQEAATPAATPAETPAATPAATPAETPAATPAAALDVDALRAELEAWCGGHGSRAPGLPGNRWLEAEVARRFAASGLVNGALTFETPVFLPGPASLTLPGDPPLTLPIEAMHPTLMRPGNFPTPAFEADLVYFGRGQQEDLVRLTGTDLRGAVGVFEYDGGDHWLQCLRFGLRGALFLGREDYFWLDSLDKVYNTEVAFARYFVSPEAAAELRPRLQAAPRQTLRAKVAAAPSRWERQMVSDPWVVIPGADRELAQNVVVFTAALDANAAVPGRAWGAQSAGNLQLLLQLLDDFRRQPPAYSVVLVAVNAHTQQYKGERLLAWFLCAASDQVEGRRNEVADDLRRAQMYCRNYAQLKLQPLPADDARLPLIVDVLWQLDARQQAARTLARQERRRQVAARQQALAADLAALDRDLGGGALAPVFAPALAALQTAQYPDLPNIAELLTLDDFTPADYQAAAARVAADYEDTQGGLRWALSSDEDGKNTVRRRAVTARELAGLDGAELVRLAAVAKPVFDDEKIFDAWRSAVDESTGFRVPIKGPLADEAQRGLNQLKLELLELSEAKQPDQPRLERLRAQRPDYAAVLKLFNKIDLSMFRVRYRDVAANPARLALLAGYVQRQMELQRSYVKYKRTYLDRDTASDCLREALDRRKVRLVVNLGLNFRDDRFGFCSLNPAVTNSWPVGLGKVSTGVAATVSAAGEWPQNPWQDTLTRVGSRPEDYFFAATVNPSVYFHGAQSVPAVTLRTTFVNDGLAFSPADEVRRLDLTRVERTQRWLRQFFRALLGSADLTDSTKGLQPPNGGQCWTTTLRSFTLDEFAAKTTPTDPVPNTLIVLHAVTPGTVQPPIVDGDVVNAYQELSDTTGQVICYSIRAGSPTLAPAAYQLDPADGTTVRYTIDKGTIQASLQNITNLNGQGSMTLPMFPCREFVIADREDPTAVGTGPITVQSYWPTGALLKAEPQKYGIMGAASLSVAQSQTTVGPAAVYAYRRSLGRQGEALLILSASCRPVLNADPAHPEGQGYVASADFPADFFGAAAADLDSLNRFRVRKMKGVKDELVEDFLAEGQRQLAAQAAAQAQRDHARSVMASAEALGNEVKAYAQTRALTGDMLKAIVFYMALMLPFCFFLQKLLFKFVRIERQLLAFVVLFVGIYVLFRFIHPAFAIAMNPEAIFIAFVLGAVGAFITWVMHARFEGEMQLLFHTYTGMQSEVGYSTVSQTAMLIGVNNMKRRRVRTTLTTGTIVLVTFVMLAFSSISKKVSPTVIPRTDSAAYTGFFYHWPGGVPMDEATLRVFQNLFGPKGAAVIVRRLLQPPKTSSAEIYNWRLEQLAESGSRTLDLEGLVGLPPADAGDLPLVAGRYFTGNDAREALLTIEACAVLRLSPDRLAPGAPPVTVRLLGEELTLVGMVDDARLRQWRDLNPNQPLLPPKLVAQQSFDSGSGGGGATDAGRDDPTALSADTAAVVLLPEGLARRLGAKPFCIAVRFPEERTAAAGFSIWQEMTTLLTVTGAKFFLGSREPFKAGAGAKRDTPAGVYYVGSNYRTAIGGLARLLIPLLIAGSIILNTMLGTVYERKGEIAVYNAIGLNPTHIFLFFLAEAFVYSVLGSVGGYLGGQTLAILIKEFGLIPGININFSSLMVVYAILFTIALVLCSTIYPAWVATRTAVPSGKRKWSLPAHDGQQMTVAFPFIYQPPLAPGVMAYLHEYFERFSEKSFGGLIASRETLHQGVDAAGRPTYQLRYGLALAPFDLGVTQTADFAAAYDPEVQSYRVRLLIQRRSGQDTNWVTTNKPFLEGLRQLLIRWRNLDPTQHAWYCQRGDQLFGGGGAAVPATVPAVAAAAAAAVPAANAQPGA